MDTQALPPDFYHSPKISILYSSEKYLVVSKPPGMIVHPQGDVSDPFNLLKFVKHQSGKYLYPIHRIDKFVSGLIIFALDSNSAKLLMSDWNSPKVQKVYWALVYGNMKENIGQFDNDLLCPKKNTLKKSLTDFEVIRKLQFGEYEFSYVKVRLHSGRFHQIRRHFSMNGFPIVGDKMYGDGMLNDFFSQHFQFENIFLHAGQLQFYDGPNVITIADQLPIEKLKILDVLETVDESIR